MEEKKFNNAIEKSENLSSDTKKVKGENAIKSESKAKKSTNTANGAKTKTQKAVSKTKNSNESQNANVNDASKENLKAKTLEEKQLAEQKRAYERIKNAEKKQQEKERRKKSRLAKKQAKERKRETLRQLKIQKREERLARRDELKNESREARLERKAKERENAMQERREKRERAAFIRREKIQARKEKNMQRAEEKRLKREQKMQERSEKRASRTSRGIGGWLAAVIVLGTATLILTTALVWSGFMTGSGENMLSGVYEKSFYDLVGYVDNIDVNLSKLTVTSDDQSRQKILSDLIVQANLAVEDLESLPLHDESRFYTVKFVNQLADFSKYLNYKLVDGGSFGEDDENNIYEFKRINGNLKNELNDLVKSMGHEFDFSTLLNGESDNVVFEKFNQLESNAVDYPKMLYDGPFADYPSDLATEKRSGEKIDEDKAVSIIKNVFDNYNLSDVRVVGSGEGKRFNVYNVEAKADNELFFAQVSQLGEIVMFDCYGDCKNTEISRDKAIDNAYAFLEKCGYKSIKAVWTTQNNNVCYVNFVNYQDDIVVYADMIKISVCMDSGKIISMDARAYLENFEKRELPHPELRVEQAESKLSNKMQVLTSRLAYIPLESGKEKLAYEFFCETAEGEEYYVYIDALNGKQLEIFKVVLTDEGTLLL